MSPKRPRAPTSGALDVLAVAAHRDDTEISVGGTLAKLVGLGYRVGILDLTQGEMGTRGDAPTREREAAAAAKVLGLHWRGNLKIPDARVELSWKNKIQVVRALRKHRPRLVIAPYWEQRHPDHATCGRLVREAVFLAGLKKLKVGGAPHRPFKVIHAVYWHEIAPSFVIDITGQIEQKIKAVACYASQFTDEKGELGKTLRGTNIFHNMRSRAHHYGALIQKEFGEPFFIPEMTEVEDPLRMPVRSI